MSNNFHILLLNGPNLNMLGIRERSLYGNITYDELILKMQKIAKELNIKLTDFQSNSENQLIDKIHYAYKKNVNYMLINIAAFTHTSIAIRDAILSVSIPFYEIHLSNIFSRDKFRHKSYLSDIAQGVIIGFGIDGYIFALNHAIKYLKYTQY
uniref:3-dehydroquinate dehydratase n=1 Tax=Candidatus Aschnera chinzeii TaxID=1485666 RepID=A0AAT9G445_9ENTR|nr:MAG: type II 3-dehydroquinate dehydratase [Candidatus Aschnera chinzeii]